MTTATDLGSQFMMAAASDTGTVRKNNEDSYYFSRKNGFFIVCDGMGGHQSGAIASKIAVETVRSILVEDVDFDIKKACSDLEELLPEPALKLVAAVRLANRRILAEATNDTSKRGMGTTIVVALIVDGWLYTAHVGDSRIYRLRNGEVTALTSDHSWLNELIEDREISENEIQQFSDKNVLTRALGTYPTVKIDLRITDVRDNDLYLLCTDGLHNALSDELIQSILNAEHESIQDATDRLVQSAKKMNGSDNITGGLLYVHGLSRPAKPISYNKTIPDETPAVTTLLDKTLKAIYHITPGSGAGKARWMPVAASVVIFLIVALIIFFRSESSGKTGNDELMASALFTQEQAVWNDQSTAGRSSAASVKPAGTLMLIQVTNPEYERIIEGIKNVRILARTDHFKKDLPVYAGRFTWAMADSNRRIIFQKNNIRISAADALSSSQQLRIPRQPSSINGLVFFSEAFEEAIYDSAYIYIDGTRLGRLRENIESGFYLRPGVYTISIRDRNGNVLRSKNNCVVEAGQILTLDF